MTVSLRPMTREEFEDYFERGIESYAADVARTRNVSLEEARPRSRKEWAGLLPQGPATPDHHLLTVEDRESGIRVGDLWFAPHPERPDTAYVYDVAIEESMRGRGLGRATMLALETRARELGFTGLQLHVFGDNEVARALYRSVGFREISVVMRKELD